MKIIEVGELYIDTTHICDVCTDGSVYDRMHACAYFENEELDEAILSDDESTRQREIRLLQDTFKNFSGDYDEAYTKFNTWIDLIDAGV